MEHHCVDQPGCAEFTRSERRLVRDGLAPTAVHDSEASQAGDRLACAFKDCRSLAPAGYEPLSKFRHRQRLTECERATEFLERTAYERNGREQGACMHETAIGKLLRVIYGPADC